MNALFKLLFSFHTHDPPCFLLLTLELKGLSLIHVHYFKANTHVRLYFLTFSSC